MLEARVRATGLRSAAGTALRVAAVMLGVSLVFGTGDGARSRTLLVALDGVSYRCVKRAQEEGAFSGWPGTQPLLSTFPSMTNVAFSAIFESFKFGPVSGYEVHHFDPEQNETIGGIVGYKKKKGAWREVFQLANFDRGDKAVMYTQPRRQMRNRIGKMERLVLDSEEEQLFVLFEATDAVAHFKGDESIVAFLHRLSERLVALEQVHLEERGRPLRIIMLSDHGNTAGKVQHADGLHKQLEQAGLRVRDQLDGPADVVAPTYGVCNFGLLFLRPELAEKAARAVVAHEGVELAAWLAGPQSLRVISADGDAVVRWRDRAVGRDYAYEPLIADPLELTEALRGMRSESGLDTEGFAREDLWLRHSGLSEYPDAPRRLVEALTGTYVRYPATVVFSLAPGFALGSPSVRLGAFFKGGKLEGTHGGLDRDSSLGFFLSNFPMPQSSDVLRADRVLRSLPGPDLELYGSVDATGHSDLPRVTAPTENSP
jgi:hypothetical protein